jgi:hypothetical protein
MRLDQASRGLPLAHFGLNHLAVFENLPATIRRSKVAISLREMSRTHGLLTGSQTPSILHAGESLFAQWLSLRTT